ncbi:MAG: hypothetical protein EXR46_02670 [Dehalococcoidia bacterium]|nr:hypothetical protein [Dehalococcoidia bacterium]
MLGKKVGEGAGRISNQRVLPSEGGAPRVETSFLEDGRLLDVNIKGMGTYTASLRPDGRLYGQGQGVVMGSGGEMLTWTGGGVGTFTGGGSISWRGALYNQSSSPAWESLNGVATVFEFDVDAEWNVKTGFWEWK